MSRSGEHPQVRLERGHRPSVLVVDDVEANLVAMEALLSELPCDVVYASSGNDALRHLLKREFAVILLDVNMPDMDGFEVARLVRQNPLTREVPIIFVTAMLETNENIFRGYESGAVDVLFKPVNPHVVVSKLTVFLDLHRAKRRLADEVDAHKRTLAELDAFNYSVSHDLRAPLRPLAGFSQILLEDHGDKLDDKGRQLLGRIGAAAQRMERIIDDLLRLAQIARSRPKAAPLDLAALARSIVADIRGGDAARSVDFVAPAEMKTRGDERLLRIALENLLRNAWKFTGRTEGARVELGSRPDGAGTAFWIKDNGVGFDQAHADKLFKAFQRLHSKEDFEGTGIGLAIVQRIIQHHGGRIWAESRPNEGATFFFTLGV